MNLSQLRGDEKLLSSRIQDMVSLTERTGGARFSSFLDERQVAIATAVLEQSKQRNYIFFGGLPDAQRQVLGVFPDFQEPDAESFPVVPLTVRYPKNINLSHRDFLGTLMSMQIERSSVGDILPGKGVCVCFVLEPVAALVLQELVKVGGAGVQCERGLAQSEIPAQAFLEKHGTVASPRIDSLVSLLAGVSRGKAAELIRRDLVVRNHVPVTGISELFSAGDTVTVQGHGKFVIDAIGNPTKKGRLPVNCRKYL